MNTQDILAGLRGRRVIVLGDVMLDRYLTGHVSRISPEAPVPVVLQESVEDRLGGAANVALNLHALGAVPVLCSVVGRDHDRHALRPPHRLSTCHPLRYGLRAHLESVSLPGKRAFAAS